MNKEEKVARVLGLKVDDARLLCERAESLGLDPLGGQIHLLPRKTFDQTAKIWKETICFQIGIEGFRLIAERSGKYDGQDPITYVVMRNGKEIRTDVILDGDVPIAAIAAVYKKGIPRPFVAVAHYRDYVGKKSDGAPTAMWHKFAIMLAKCAEAAAIRKGFPDLGLGEAYEPAEMFNSDDESHPRSGDDIKNMVHENGNKTTAPWTAFDPKPVDKAAAVEPVASDNCPAEPAPAEPVKQPADATAELATESQKTAILRLAKLKGVEINPDALDDLTKLAAAEKIKLLNSKDINKKAA